MPSARRLSPRPTCHAFSRWPEYFVVPDYLDSAFIIDRRFRGPPHSGNGGYTAGRLAAFVDWPAGRVMLKAPPPLDKVLRVEKEGAVVRLFDGETLLAVADPSLRPMTSVEPVSFEEAEAASRLYAGFQEHVCPGCFVCGPERDDGDGLRIFAGPVDGRDLFAALWMPRRGQGDASGYVRSENLWAALDCPTYFALPGAGTYLLLGSMTAEVFERPPIDEPLIVTARATGAEGRKHFAASAIYSRDGEQCYARAECLWIALRDDQKKIYDEERCSA